MRRIGGAVALLAVMVALLAALLALFGFPPGKGLAAFWRGSIGTSYALVSATLVRAIPLSLAGLGVAMALRGGRLNVGAEGQLLAGATAAATCAQLARATEGQLALLPGGLVLVGLLLAGALAGAAWAGIAGWLRERFGVLEVISTIMLNYVAIYGVGALVRGPLQEPSHVYPQSATLIEASRLPVLVPTTRLHAGVVVVVLLAIALWWMLRTTAVGFRIRAVGASPTAAASAGQINVARISFGALALGGALAGLAGSTEYAGVTFALYENLSPGYGYTAIAVALLARLHPLGILASGLLFGALEAGGAAMQRDAGVPATLVQVLEGLLILGIVLIDRRRAHQLAGGA
jgi:simple sugar transport system permease protein